ncbi:hypothetical protein [Kitasatospora sp. NPDC059571]|uniref:hypothetical protein n=1 Tax=Kitasatospora sp. NPDC059571 TaxID=3346871 RepID=UPI00369A5E65
MPSLRQPVGPLPASIYWRRRLVVLAALVAVGGLVAWLALGPGGGKSQKTAQAAPAQSITPGASPSGSAITSRPGGTGGGTGGTTGGSGGVSGSTGGDVSLTGGTTGGGSDGGSGGSNDATSGGTGTGGSSSGGAGGSSGGATSAPPVNTSEVMALPACSTSQVSLELASTLNAYSSKVKPRLALTVRNTSGANCRVDLGRTVSTLTVSSTSGERVWSSGDCPSSRQATWVQLGAGSGLTETFTWDRSRSKPQCASTDGTAAQPGSYLVQADLALPSGGQVSARTSMRLEA